MILQLRMGVDGLVWSFAQIAGGTTQHVLLITHGCGGIPRTAIEQHASLPAARQTSRHMWPKWAR